MIDAAMTHYDLNDPELLCKTKKEVLEDIAKGKKSGDIPRSAKPKIIKFVVEVL